MSKSLGNFIPLPDLLARYDPRAYRLLVLQSHYRGPMTVADSTMSAATQTMERLDAFARRFASSAAGGSRTRRRCSASAPAMDDDLDTPRATAQLFELVDPGQRPRRRGPGRRGGRPRPPPSSRSPPPSACASAGRPAEVDDAALALAAERDEARRQKDYGLGRRHPRPAAGSGLDRRGHAGGHADPASRAVRSAAGDAEFDPGAR